MGEQQRTVPAPRYPAGVLIAPRYRSDLALVQTQIDLFEVAEPNPLSDRCHLNRLLTFSLLALGRLSLYSCKFFHKMLLRLSGCCAAALVASDRDCVA